MKKVTELINTVRYSKVWKRKRVLGLISEIY